MNIVVCVKRVPLTQEVDLEIDPKKNDVRKDMLAYVINEWDNYAVEEAVRLKEKLEGHVTAITIGNEDDEEVLRRCLAMGADKAIRVDPGDLEPAQVLNRGREHRRQPPLLPVRPARPEPDRGHRLLVVAVGSPPGMPEPAAGRVRDGGGR